MRRYLHHLLPKLLCLVPSHGFSAVPTLPQLEAELEHADEQVEVAHLHFLFVGSVELLKESEPSAHWCQLLVDEKGDLPARHAGPKPAGMEPPIPIAMIGASSSSAGMGSGSGSGTDSGVSLAFFEGGADSSSVSLPVALSNLALSSSSTPSFSHFTGTLCWGHYRRRRTKLTSSRFTASCSPRTLESLGSSLSACDQLRHWQLTGRTGS